MIDKVLIPALWSTTRNCSERKDWMNKTNISELQRAVKKMSTFIALLIRNDGLKILLFLIFYYMLCSFSHKLNGSGFNPPTYFRYISNKRGKMSMEVAP